MKFCVNDLILLCGMTDVGLPADKIGDIFSQNEGFYQLTLLPISVVMDISRKGRQVDVSLISIGSLIFDRFFPILLWNVDSRVSLWK